MTSELADLEHHLDLANKSDFHGLPGGAKAEALLAVSRMRNKLDALDAKVITAFEATQEHRAEGHPTVIGWLQHHRREHANEASRRRRLAKRLPALPYAQEAMETGEITEHHVTVLDRARRMVGDEAYAIAEQALVDAAVVKRFADFARLVEYFIFNVAPGDANERDRKRFEERYASSSRTLDGDGKIDAWMPKLGFTVWQDELDRLMEVEYRKDVAEAADRLGRRPLPSELARTIRQRRVDAMEEMARRSGAYDGPELGPTSFRLVVHGDAELIARILEVLLDPDGTPEDLDQIELPPDSLHELADGTPVTVNTIVLALLTGAVRGLLYDPEGEVLRYGRDRRFFGPAQTQTLLAKYRRCVHPYGCDRTGKHLQANHKPEWQRGGHTDIDMADTRCGPHNRWYTNTHGQPPPPGPTDDGQRRFGPR